MTTQRTKKLLSAIRKALRFLNKLGTAGAIASYFTNNGLRGRVGSFTSCPIANYLSLVTGENINVEAFYAAPDGRPNKVTLPANVAEFVRSFDHGGLPECKLVNG